MNRSTNRHSKKNKLKDVITVVLVATVSTTNAQAQNCEKLLAEPMLPSSNPNAWRRSRFVPSGVSLSENSLSSTRPNISAMLPSPEALCVPLVTSVP